MATVLKLNVQPVSLSAAFYAFTILQRTIEEVMPEASSVTIRVEPSGSIKAEIVARGTPIDAPAGATPHPAVAAANQQKIMFKVDNGMVPGYRLMHPVLGFENGNKGRRTVTVVVGTTDSVEN